MALYMNDRQWFRNINFKKTIALPVLALVLAIQSLVIVDIPAVLAATATVQIASVADLQNAVRNQADGQTWNIAAGNGWHGINVDKPGAVLTVQGANTHSDNLPIYVDDTTVGQVVDVTNQYVKRENVFKSGDAVYALRMAAPQLVSPVDGAYANGSSLTNTWSSVEGAKNYVYESYHDAAANSLRWRQTVDGTSKTATNVADGVFWWRVKAVDAYGNSGAWSPLWKVTIDNTMPTISLSGISEGDTNPASFVVTANDNAALSEVTVIVRSSNGTEIVNSCPKVVAINGEKTYTTTCTLPTSLTSGSYNIRYNVKDLAGNKTVPAQTNFTVDKTAPAYSKFKVEQIIGGNVGVSTPLAYNFVVSAPVYRSGSSFTALSYLLSQTSDSVDSQSSVDSTPTTPTQTTPRVLADVDTNQVDLGVDAVDGGSAGFDIWGLLADWWYLILIVAAALLWWIIAAVRRRKDEE